MPVNSTHPQYDAALNRWQRCRDCYEGEDAVKSRGTEYLPKPGGLTDKEYKDYSQRALFYECVGRTIDGFVGAIARKPPVIEASEKLNDVIGDITLDGLSVEELIKQLCTEIILQGRGALLGDYDEKTQRAYLRLYPAEAITNWSEGSVVVNETVYEPDAEDAFKQNSITQYRHLTVVGGIYTVTIWRKIKNKDGLDEWAVYDTRVPTIKGKTFSEIPWFWLTPLGKTSRIERPPMLGLVSVSLSHFRNSADLEHGLHYTGLPTLCVAGDGFDADAKISVGSLSAIITSDSTAKVWYAEVKGDFKGLENTMQGKEAKMAVLGASVFADEKKGVESEATARIRQSGQTSLLSGVVTAVEETLTAALQCVADWMGAAGKVSVTLNREFVDTKMDGPTLVGLVAAFQSGALTIEQFLYNLQQGDLLAPDTDIEEEAVAVAAAKKVADAAAAKLNIKPAA